MRIGLNPYKNQLLDMAEYSHQVIIPVFIPNQEGYFKDSFAIFKLCLESLFKTIHANTFITIVNNGSCSEVRHFIDALLANHQIHEVIHTDNIGKLNAIYKGLVGNKIALVTISDADVLFANHWQSETVTIFNKFPKAGVVGLVPQFSMFKSNCENVILSNIFSSKLKFLPAKNPEAMVKFYDSIGWERDYNQDYLRFVLGLEADDDLKVLIGSGHFVATYKRTAFDSIHLYSDYKMGGKALNYLDVQPLRTNHWRLTTYDNFAYHMGNVAEPWMYDLANQIPPPTASESYIPMPKSNSTPLWWNLIRNKIFHKLVMNKNILKLLYFKWKLPAEIVKNY